MASPRHAKTQKIASPIRRAAVTLLLAIACVLAIAFLLLISLNPLIKVGIAVLILIAIGHMVATANGLKDSYGAYLLGSKRGIKFIESLANKNPKFWTALADWGLVCGFGVLSFFLFGKYVNRKTMLLGIATIAVIIVFVYPYLPIVFSFINIPQITSRISAAPAVRGFGSLFYVFLAVSVLGGFGASTMLLILFSGGSILYTTLLFLTGFFAAKPNYNILTQQIPGVAPLIPGLTIPLFAGIISLFILLVVHEFSHGILAKISKVKIKSIGAILFGIVPLGAFVEPNENEVKKLNERYQNRISIAGVSANLVTCLVFFVLSYSLLTYVLPSIDTHGVLVLQTIKNMTAYGVMAPNSVIQKWNNVTIRNSFDLANVEAQYTSGSVLVTTNQGAFSLIPNSQGRLGVITAPAYTGPVYQFSNFIYAVAALSFGLNFFVAIFNLLPIPSFDGWRIYQNKVKDKRLLKLISSVLIVAILLNVLPWFWTIS